MVFASTHHPSAGQSSSVLCDLHKFGQIDGNHDKNPICSIQTINMLHLVLFQFFFSFLFTKENSRICKLNKRLLFDSQSRYQNRIFRLNHDACVRECVSFVWFFLEIVHSLKIIGYLSCSLFEIWCHFLLDISVESTDKCVVSSQKAPAIWCVVIDLVFCFCLCTRILFPFFLDLCPYVESILI